MKIDKYKVELIINKKIDYIKYNDVDELITVFYFQEKSLKNIKQFDLISYYIPFFFVKKYRDINMKFISLYDYKVFLRNKNFNDLLG